MRSMEKTIQVLARASLTDRMKAVTVTLLAEVDVDTGRVLLSRRRLLELLRVGEWDTARKYLGRLRAAGLLDYQVGSRTVAIWFLAWYPGYDVGPAAGQERYASVSAADGSSPTGMARRRPLNGAPWARERDGAVTAGGR